MCTREALGMTRELPSTVVTEISFFCEIRHDLIPCFLELALACPTLILDHLPVRPTPPQPWLRPPLRLTCQIHHAVLPHDQVGRGLIIHYFRRNCKVGFRE